MSWRDSRKITERIVVEGDLILLTPTSLGGSDGNDGLTDMPLLLDEIEGRALLMGTSIAGALRNYLRERLLNFEVSEESQFKDQNGKRLKDTNGNKLPLPIVTRLFGSLEDDGSQSFLIVDDALSGEKPATELRDGVRIKGKTRTAYLDKKGRGSKFDLELLESGTSFKLRFELLICEGHDRNESVSAFAAALQGFENSEIHIGARKRRGYGECEAKGWKVKSYKLRNENSKDLLDWLRYGAKTFKELTAAEKEYLQFIENDDISQALAVSIAPDSDKRDYFQLDAAFAIDGSILIRSGSKISDKYQPDSVHLRSGGKAIISGTSLAGVLRHRALKIAKTIGDSTKAKTFVDAMFGVDMEERKKEKWSSRLEIKEKPIDETKTDSLVQTRVKIDRFTGGAFESALFDAAPVFSNGNDTAVEVSFKLRFKHDQPQAEKDAEIGLLLLLLKDFWTSDLPIGGKSSIGRGRLKGKTATLRFNQMDQIVLESEGENKIKPLAAAATERLNEYVKVFNREIKQERNDGHN